MDVLLSIKPHFAEHIFDGKKKYEYRRTIFNRKDVQKILVYASSPVKKIIGEFHISSLIYDKPELIWLRTRTSAGISKDLFFRYFVGKDKGYAIGIKHAKEYGTPFDPVDIIRDFVPPQSFMYIDSDKFGSRRTEHDLKPELTLVDFEPLCPLAPASVIRL
jgi:predicted transcriptional regulator